MTSHELSTLAGAYALDSLDEAERAEFEEHLAGCADCAAEVAGLRAAVAELSQPTVVPAPPALRTELLAEIARVRPLPPRAGSVSPLGRRLPRRFWPALAAACALIAVLAAGWGVQQHRQLTAAQHKEPTGLSAIFDSSDVTATPVALGQAGRATLIYSKAKQQLLLVGQHVPVPPDGKTYQLWMLSPSGAATSGGLFRPDADGNVVVQASGDLARTAHMGISVEASGGAAQPTPGAIIADIPI
jgi:anti-sigma-K factor RskA